MKTLSEQSPEFCVLAEKLSALGAKLIDGLSIKESGYLLNRDTGLFSSSANEVYLLKEGSLACFVSGKQLFYLEEGEVLGLERGFPIKELDFRGDFAVKLDVYSAEELLARVRSEPARSQLYSEYLLTYLGLMAAAWQDLTRQDRDLSPCIQIFEAGEVIVRQDSPAAEVLNLVKGHAEVEVNGIKVGEILEDEIFGALAALTDTRRTATVTATTRCEVLALERENFINLIESRPRTVLKMVQDMARTIVSLNKQVVELGFKKG